MDSISLFFQPEKDQCDLWTAFKNEPTSVDELTMKQHLHQKELAGDIMNEARARSQQDPNYVASCFDIQKVLECPHG